MTEQQWLACTDPVAILEFLRGKASDRKLRLFAVACCRRIWKLLANERCHRAVEIAERCAEGFLSVEESYALGHEMDLSSDYDLAIRLQEETGHSTQACHAALRAVGLITGCLDQTQAGRIAGYASTAVVLQIAPHLGDYEYGEEAAFQAAAIPFRAAENVAQAALLRDIFGNPFRHVPFMLPYSRNSKDKTVEQLAQSIYDGRQLLDGTLENEGLARLAEVLLDDGCANVDILNHCRETGPHVRGCWVIDVLLRKKSMTEANWLTCTDLNKMLEFLRHFGLFTVRKSRLFGVAMCRRIWNLLSDNRSKNAVEVAERYADGNATAEETIAASQQALQAGYEMPRNMAALRRAVFAASEVSHSHESPENVAWQISNAIEVSNPLGAGEENEIHIALLRCLLGNPFRPITIDTTWLRPKVVSLAKGIYDNRSFELLPILADTLEEAGCSNSEMLAHCRGPGPHVRGCWVVDLLLGKE